MSHKLRQQKKTTTSGPYVIKSSSTCIISFPAKHDVILQKKIDPQVGLACQKRHGRNPWDPPVIFPIRKPFSPSKTWASLTLLHPPAWNKKENVGHYFWTQGDKHFSKINRIRKSKVLLSFQIISIIKYKHFSKINCYHFNLKSDSGAIFWMLLYLSIGESVCVTFICARV